MLYKVYNKDFNEFFYDNSFLDYIPKNESAVDKCRRISESYHIQNDMNTRILDMFENDLKELNKNLSELNEMLKNQLNL